ncbi:MAG: DUF309 domain-containing protein [Planctomycetota bacterium]|jgi:uncharacterized protein|nr:DUF309 domain-containing protein [Planctomycetota bacterium]
MTEAEEVPDDAGEPTDPTLGRPVEGSPGAPPLLLPDQQFPPYRFVPGRAPHPFAHEGGWGYGEDRSPPPFLSREAWRDNRAYLSGCDYFNRGWWWEAHEVWEELWHVVEGKDAVQHDLLKSLIQLAAAALNRERSSDKGAARLLGRAEERLRRVQVEADAEVVMGLDLKALCCRAVEHLGSPTVRVDGFYLEPR